MSNSINKSIEFESAAIEAQLERILNTHKFLVADQLSRFLRFVVEDTLAGRQDQIKQYTIAVKALGRDTHFNPETDPVVRMQARKLRRALHRYYDTDGRNDPIRIEIPKGRYIPVFLSNQAQPQSSESYADTPPPISTSALEDSMLTLPHGPSIAVLPFPFLGNNEEDAYFASGLTEEIVIALTRFPEFRVIGPLNRDKIWKQHLGPRGIGREYEVRFVLDGTVRKRGQILRVTAKLSDAVSGQHIWAQTLEHNLQTTSVLDVENEIVSQVSATIADNFGIIPRTLSNESSGQRPDSLSDYEAILRFYHHSNVVTEASFVEAMTALEHALQRNPDHAVVAALLGDLLATAYHLGYEDSLSVLEQAEKLGRKAVGLDPNCQPARFTMALVYFLRLQRGRCLEEIEQLLRLNPNHANYVAASALLLTPMGEWKRGISLMNKAMRLNPHHPGWYHFVPFLYYYCQGEYNSALNEAQRFNTPEYFWDPLIRGAALGQLGRQAEANEAVDELIALVPDFEQRGRSLIHRVVFLEENVEMLVAGLRRAGLELAG